MPEWPTSLVHIRGFGVRHGHYLQKRGDRYQFRLPAGIAPFTLPGEIVVNLKTNSRSLAITRARALRVALDPLLTDLALTLDRAEADHLVRGWIDRHAQDWEVNIAAIGGLAYFTKAEGEVMGPAQSREMDDLMRVVGDMMVRPRLKATAQAALSGRRPDAFQSLEPVVAGAMEDIAPEIDRDSLDGHFLARTMYKGRAEDLKRNAGIVAMLKARQSWSAIQAATGCSRATVAKRLKAAGASLPA